MKKIKIEIKSRWDDSILFEYEKEDNTLKDTLEKAIKEAANLYGANLYGANLYGANLKGAYLKGAYLEGAYLEGANLKGANLEGANLYGANLYGANLEGANLYGANLYGANLKGANLYGANLYGANLYGANLKGAYLYMWDNDEPNIKEIIEKLENNSNLRVKNYYINKHILSPYYLTYWKNGLIIDEYEIVEKKEVKEMTLAEISKALGYDVKIIKEDK